MKKARSIAPSPAVLPGPEAARRVPARKALGQHFLTDEVVLQQILSASELEPTDTVVEVGPGLGAVTRRLVGRAGRVIAIEMDHRLAASLGRSLGNPPNLRVINADAREVDLAEALDAGTRYKMVANLPYYAANPIMRRFLEADAKPSLMVVMVQSEVARSMVAEGGRMSLLAVGIQIYGIPSIICEVPSRAFYPPPKVTSAVVRIDLRPRPAVEVDDMDGFFDIVRAGFSAPRKQLRNSLGLGLGVSTDQASSLLASVGLDPRRRAETLGLEEWGCLYRAWRGRKGDRGNQSLCEDKSDPGGSGPPLRRLS